jgi:F0F1-type ATP synthase epsilon subunit
VAASAIASARISISEAERELRQEDERARESRDHEENHAEVRERIVFLSTFVAAPL